MAKEIDELDITNALKRVAKERMMEREEEKKKNLERVKNDLLNLAAAIGARVNVDFEDSEFPEVRIAEAGISMYDRGYGDKGRIVIVKKDIDKGEAYAEEVTHFLRDHALRKKNEFDLSTETREFFGRLGVRIGREVSEGTRLDSLFKDSGAFDWGSEEMRQRIGKRYGLIRHEIKSIDSETEAERLMRASISGRIGDSEEQLEEYFDRYNMSEINQDDLIKGIGVVREQIELKIHGLKQKYGEKVDVSALRDYKHLLDQLKNNVNPNDRSEYDTKKKRIGILSLINRFRQEYKKNEEERDNADLDNEAGNVAKLVRRRALREEASAYRTHRKPYSFADKVDLSGVYNDKGFFYMSWNEIRKRFFKKEKSKLERIATDVFYVLTPFFIVYVLFAMRQGITGMVSVISPEKAVFGSLIGIVWFVFFVLFLYLQVKRRAYAKV